MPPPEGVRRRAGGDVDAVEIMEELCSSLFLRTIPEVVKVDVGVEDLIGINFFFFFCSNYEFLTLMNTVNCCFVDLIPNFVRLDKKKIFFYSFFEAK